MLIEKKAVAGTLESNDIFVEVEPGNGGIEIEIQSVVYNQFARQIEAAIRDILKEFNVTDAKVRVDDRGAVDYAVRARVETAVRRAGVEAKASC